MAVLGMKTLRNMFNPLRRAGGRPGDPAGAIQATRIDAPPRPRFHQQAALEGI
jgi:hypothetical protein